MSLWTPDGEVPVDRSGAEERPATSASEMLGGPNLDDLSPEERAQAEEMIARMAEVQRQLLSHPASVFVANHLMGLYELAAVHLDQPEPKYDEVRLAIDAMTSMLDATEDRLSESGAELRQALTVLQTVYVQRVNASESRSPLDLTGNGGDGDRFPSTRSARSDREGNICTDSDRSGSVDNCRAMEWVLRSVIPTNNTDSSWIVE